MVVYRWLCKDGVLCWLGLKKKNQVGNFECCPRRNELQPREPPLFVMLVKKLTDHRKNFKKNTRRKKKKLYPKLQKMINILFKVDFSAFHSSESDQYSLIRQEIFPKQAPFENTCIRDATSKWKIHSQRQEVMGVWPWHLEWGHNNKLIPLPWNFFLYENIGAYKWQQKPAQLWDMSKKFCYEFFAHFIVNAKYCWGSRRAFSDLDRLSAFVAGWILQHDIDWHTSYFNFFFC